MIVDGKKKMIVDFRKPQKEHSAKHQERQIPQCLPSGEPLLIPQHQLHSQESTEVSLLCEKG